VAVFLWGMPMVFQNTRLSNTIGTALSATNVLATGKALLRAFRSYRLPISIFDFVAFLLDFFYGNKNKLSLDT